jgi:structural maintenance of chromosome 1
MAPNMKAGDAFDNVVDQLEECNEDFSKAKELSKVASQHFEEIKRQRSDRFNTAFKYVSDSLTTIYKDMTKSSKHPLGGNAYLSIDDADEPYNGGIKFTAMPPMKRYRDMEYLSGGEKTIAALALLFAIHSYHPAPFFVMDEVDAALDNVNVLKLCNYIRQRSKDFQCIVISLKDMFFEKSESLVGICRDAPTNSSRTLTLDLTRFDNGEESITSTSISSNRKRSSSFSVASIKRNKSLQ